MYTSAPASASVAVSRVAGARVCGSGAEITLLSYLK